MQTTASRDTRAHIWQRVLWLALPILFVHPFVPLEEFIHRGDDAFYYFQLARNHARDGFWSFDGLHPSNGVQALWAWITTALAHLATALGVTDPLTLARLFVFVSALLTFTAGMGLYRILARAVTPGTALIAAGAWMLPLAPVWSRVWGMENSVYAVGLVAVAATLLPVLQEPTDRRAGWLGLALGLTALARFNATLLVPIACLAVLLETRRWRPALIAGTIATALVVPYLSWNLISTGHVLPVSGAAKAIYTTQMLQEVGATSRLSPEFASLLYRAKPHATWFVGTHVTSVFWVLGGRLTEWFGQDSPGGRTLVALVLGTILAGAAAGPARWGQELRSRVRALRPFAWLAVFAAVNVLVSVVLYPTQIPYAIPRWWLVESEMLIVVLAAVLLASTLATIGSRLPARVSGRLTTGLVTALVLAHGVASTRFYWDGVKQTYDWNGSWNEYSFEAGRWLRDNVPASARVGSWNAGVLGYFAAQPVINLDGLINGFDFLPYLRDKVVDRYILEQRIAYLADMEDLVVRHRLHERLALQEVYARYSPAMRQHYRIYRVLGPRSNASAAH